MKAFLKKIARKFGYDILHLPTDPRVRQQLWLLEKNHIDLIFDIGANQGQFANKIREWGYNGNIVSFEPLPEPFALLKKHAAKDPLWDVENFALGNFDGDIEINISQNSYSSSILQVLPSHKDSAPDSKCISKMKVPIKKVDSIIDHYYSSDQNLFIKIDTQGFERFVFEGCLESLEKIMGFQMELSFLPLYEGETLIQEMIGLLRQNRYYLMFIEPGYQNFQTGELVQMEGVFYFVQ